MKKLKFCLFLVTLFGVFISSCVSAPTPEEKATAYYGNYPENYERIIKDYLEWKLIDPSSAKYRFPQPPIKGFHTSFGGNTQFGYRGVVHINSKNQMGGYAGPSKYVYIIRDNNVIVFEEIL